MDVCDVINTALPFINSKDPSTVITCLVVMVSLMTLQKMILSWWEHRLVQPGPLKKEQ